MTEKQKNVLLADDGMVLTDGTSFGKVVYLGKEADEAKWHEIPEAEAERMQNAEVPPESEATESDYINALERLGVNFNE